MNYWVVSPNVSKNPQEEPLWKKVILDQGIAMMGWGEDHPLGNCFIEKVKKGDIILVAQGANRQKRVFLCGEVSSDAIYGHLDGAPGEAFYRRLKYIINKEELEALQLDFISSAYGDSSQPNAIYELKPYKNPIDKSIADALKDKVNQIKEKHIMQNKINLLRYKYQIILQGPPGTGKTHLAKDLAYKLIFDKIIPSKRQDALKELEKSDQFQLIQFHPAYSYEDFVRGISTETNGNIIEYKTKNKLLAEFANKALENFKASTMNNDELSKEQFFDQKFEEFKLIIGNDLALEGNIRLTNKVELNYVEEDGFAYSGNNWGGKLLYSQLKKMYLYDIHENREVLNHPDLAGHIVYRTAYYLPILNRFREMYPYIRPVANNVPLKNFVLVIDEINRANLPAVLGELIYALEYRGEGVKSMYKLEDDERMLVLPPNLYIIGTMNTADRSIGHIDYAIRRRFAFVDILPDKKPVPSFALDLFKEVCSLFISNYDTLNWENPQLEKSSFLATDFRPEDVWIGHSYFIATDEDQLRLKLEFEIKPILKEYLKDGILLSTADDKIKKL